MALYKIIAGSHQHEGTLHKAPATLELDYDPRKRWKNKFELISSEPAKAANKKKATTSEDDDDDDKKEVKVEDKTDRFDDAVENDLKVLKEGKLYKIYSPDDMDDPINDKDITNMDDVEAWLADYVKE